MIRKILLFLCFWLSISSIAMAGDSSSTVFSAVIEPYYVWKNNNSGSRLPSILGNYRNTDQFNLNILLLNADFSAERIHGSAELVAGTYAEANLSAENDFLRHVFQAYCGFLIHKNLWIDAGVFPSPIGFESANPIGNWTLTRSMLAENSPYYLTGVRSIYTHNKFTIGAYLVNGWQTIGETDRNKAFCFQATYSNKKTTINISTFSGKVQQNILTGNITAIANSWRNYLNFYYIQQLKKGFFLTAGWDLGLQELPFTNNQKIWTTACLIAKEKVNEKFETAQRIEFFIDKNQFISSLNLKDKPLYATSFNIDYLPAKNLRARLEPRLLWSEKPLFRNKNNFVGEEFFITASIILSI